MLVPKEIIKVPFSISRPQGRTRNPDEYIPTMNQVRMRWNSKIADAQRIWNKISKSELLEVQGQKLLLVEAIQKHYSTARKEANKRVNQFFEEHMS